MRSDLVLAVLLDNDYTPEQTLAETFKVSKRTIQNDIKQLNGLEAGFVIKKQKLGYSISITNSDLFQQYFDSLEFDIMDSQEMRLDKICFLLLLSSSYITIQFLANELCSSSSQIKKDLKKLEQPLKQKGLILEKKAHYGIRVRASLAEKIAWLLQQDSYRRFMTEYLTEPQQAQLGLLLSDWFQSCAYIPDIPEMQLAEQEFLLLLCMEIASGSLDSEELELVLDQDLETVKQLFSKEKRDFLENSLSIRTGQRRDTSPLSLKKRIGEYFQGFDALHQTECSSDEEFLNVVCLHIAALIERSRKGIVSVNPNASHISKYYPVMYNEALKFSRWLEELYQITIISGEIAYLATHMLVPYQKGRQRRLEQRYRIGVICSSGGGIAQLVHLKLRRIFPNAVIRTFSLLEKKRIQKFQPDVIFSIVALDFSLPCPVIHLDEIQGNLDDLSMASYLDSFHGSRSSSMGELFLEWLSPSFFTIRGKEDYREILGELASQLEVHNHQRGYKQSLLEREDYLSTIYAHGVAIPHPMEMRGRNNIISVCLLPHGVQTEGLQPKVIFMVSLKEREVEKHQIISQVLSKLMDNPLGVEALLKTESYPEFRYTLKQLLEGK
ncbi:MULTISPECIES: PTS sugar transporter subunit IIA [unclassified Streptococcus]|uniref:BglG family transcription antiterminator n=1 Tax=unclassified Streptococcus TaxID=2608887 RepID=UPI001071E45A|nr:MULTISPECIES: PTS sugar transporter subunit IIA [unclassified Streptococcus]MBF0786338.1 PTS sugar transporter subunit IIA [Streptococcus sp. 19428wC2_LYSM12]MCQ9212447.1 PTS sugar transporter subunit IIA [Streptococcus sp. B01]MCQ9213785.1 PTS sugar transporter subunit IIA [Streptococcus sp. O1]TFV06749.1 PRD domain-containing protein [Streptococcus sp. LYSM12]